MAGKTGILTCQEHSTLIADDRQLIPLLTAAGFSTEIVVWNEPDRVSLPEFILVRTPWDYYKDYPAFLKFLDGAEAAGSKMFNPYALIRWNLDKRYLAELEGKGVPVLPTVFIPKGASLWERDHALITIPWPKDDGGVVVKPTVSAGSFMTSRVTGDLTEVDLAVGQVAAVQAVMVQPFAADIAKLGEISLVYFNDGAGWRLSHSVLKKAGGSDFRVQAEFGGSEAPCEPSAEQLAIAEKTLVALPEPGLYARVDLIPWQGSWVLSEVELVEPQLFFRFAPGAAERFVDAFTKWSRY